VESMGPTRIFTFSARSVEALHRLVGKHLELLTKDGAVLNLSHYSYTLNAGRAALEHRCWVTAQTKDELVEILRLFIAQKSDPRWAYHLADRKESRKVLSTSTFDPTEAAKWYLSGASIDWNRYVDPSDRQIIDIPKYTFADDRYWLLEHDFKSKRSIPEAKEPARQVNTASLQVATAGSSSGEMTAPSLTYIVRMQLDQASKALNRVTASQLSILTPGIGVAHIDQTHEIEHTQTNTDVAPQAVSEFNSVNIIDRCGEWSLMVTPILEQETDAEAKQRLIKTFENHQPFEAGNPSKNGTVPTNGRTLACTFSSSSDAIAALTDEKGKRIFTGDVNKSPNALIFMFPGVGDHYVNMGLGLYESDADFRADIEYCCAKVGSFIDSPLLEVLYPVQKTDDLAQTADPKPAFDFKAMLGREAKVNPEQERMNETRHSQTLVFIIEYAMARLWQRRGIHPDAMIGYSIGEYVAAVLAGIMSIDDALELVGRRSMLIEKLPGGSLLAVPLDEHAIKPYLSGSGLSVAINSTPNLTVVGGDDVAIDALLKTLSKQDIVCRKLQSTHAFHTPMLKVLDAELRELVGRFTLRPPTIPVVSNVTGSWMTAAEAVDPAYWARHTWQTVRFAQGVGVLLDQANLNSTKRRIFLEVGPGVSLGSFMLQHPDASKMPYKINVPSLRTVYERMPDQQLMLNTEAKLLLAGYSPSNHIK